MNTNNVCYKVVKSNYQSVCAFDNSLYYGTREIITPNFGRLFVYKRLKDIPSFMRWTNRILFCECGTLQKQDIISISVTYDRKFWNTNLVDLDDRLISDVANEKFYTTEWVKPIREVREVTEYNDL